MQLGFYIGIGIGKMPDIRIGGGGTVLGALVLTRTSSAGTNPPTWDWNPSTSNPEDGDTVELYYTTDGSTPVATGTPQGSITYDARLETINWGSAWPNPFPGGITVKWAERYGRVISGSMVWSPLSNVLSDNMPSAGVVYTPSSSGVPTIQTNSAASHTFPNMQFGAGVPMVSVGGYNSNSVVLTPTGGGTSITIPLTVASDQGTVGRQDTSHYVGSSPIAAGSYTVEVDHTLGANDVCTIQCGTLTGLSTGVVRTFSCGTSVSSTSYAAAIGTLTTGQIFVACAFEFAVAGGMGWHLAGVPKTPDCDVETTVTFSAIHGTGSGTLSADPTTGGFGAMCGVVLG